MTVELAELLPILLYVALIALVVALIVLVVKVINTLKKVDIILDDVNQKMVKVDGLFNIIDNMTDYAANLSDRIIGGITNMINLVFHRKKGRDKDE